jgi:LysR family nitrogen assimilation transcriptional regulator
MDLKQLEYFVRVAELGSFTKASTMMRVAQPALSRQIRALEEELGESLLIRTGRGVKTTEAGNRLLEHARGILRLVARALEDLENARTGKAGRIAIGMPTSVSRTLTAPLIARLKEALPDASITVLNGRSAQLQEWLLSGTLDMALEFDAAASPVLDVQELGAEQLFLYSPPGDRDEGKPVEMSALADLPMIINSRPNTVRMKLDSELAQLGRRLNIAFELDSMDTSFELVQGGFGHTIRSKRAARDSASARGLPTRPIIHPELHISLKLVRLARRPRNRVQETAAQILRELSVELLG